MKKIIWGLAGLLLFSTLIPNNEVYADKYPTVQEQAYQNVGPIKNRIGIGFVKNAVKAILKNKNNMTNFLGRFMDKSRVNIVKKVWEKLKNN